MFHGTPLGHQREYAPNCANRVSKRHFLASVRYVSPQTPLFPLQWLKIYNSSGTCIKRGKVLRIDMKIDNILLEMNNGFSVKCWQKVCTKFRKLSLKIAIFYPAGVGYCFLLVSASAFSGTGNMSFSHTFRHSILTSLGHSNWYLDHYSRTNNDGVRGQDGVTGVKKVIFTKTASSPTEFVALKASSPSEYVALTCDLRTCISLTPSTKVLVLKIIRVDLGSQGSKCNFHLKASSPKEYVALTCDVCICNILTPSTKVMVLKINPGSFF